MPINDNNQQAEEVSLWAKNAQAGDTAVKVDAAGDVNVDLVAGTALIGGVTDRFTGGEALADQAGTGSALTFTFSSPVDLIWVRVDGDVGRADPFGGTPSASAGIYCDNGVPNPITITTSSIQVFTSSLGTAHVWGFRY